MNILQINTADIGGGAEGSAYNLYRRFAELGHNSMLAVGTKYRQESNIVEIPLASAGLLRHGAFYLAERARTLEKRGVPGMRKINRIFSRLGSAERCRQWRMGLEETAFPGCGKLLEALPFMPDVIHIHNMHGWYFDWEMLPELSRRFPVVINLRDTWALTGHCAYFMDCQKWKTGCGQCPDLQAYPGIHRDASAENWKRKADVFARSRLFVTAPSQWLLDCAKMSMLSALEYKVIPNGIDTAIFRQGDQKIARLELGLPQEAKIVMFATASKKNIFKDMSMMKEVVGRLSSQDRQLHFLCIGTDLGISMDNLHSLGYVSSPKKMAQCYQAADVFLHTAKAEAFGKTVTEAMACGTPVVASAVGGLPEQIMPGRTGALANAPGEFVEEIKHILSLPESAYRQMSMQAAEHGSKYSLERQAQNFLGWYSNFCASF